MSKGEEDKHKHKGHPHAHKKNLEPDIVDTAAELWDQLHAHIAKKAAEEQKKKEKAGKTRKQGSHSQDGTESDKPLTEKVSQSMTSMHRPTQHNLLEEMRRKKKMKGNLQGDVFTLLKSQATLTEKVFARQKKSAKEVFLKSSYTPAPKTREELIQTIETDIGASLYNYNIRSRFPISPEMQVEIDKIRQENEKKAQKGWCWTILEKLMSETIIGQTILANPRFYSMDPLEHLPEMCRRCKHPLADTLSSRFTIQGILYALLIPILGIILLFSNKEFVCVVCGETYVYGDLTPRPEKETNIVDIDAT